MATKDEILAFIRRKYVCSADARQRALGLEYVLAETSDLAEELERFLAREHAECASDKADTDQQKPADNGLCFIGNDGKLKVYDGKDIKDA